MRAAQVVAEDAAILNQYHHQACARQCKQRNEFPYQNAARGIGWRVMNQPRRIKERSHNLAEKVVEPGEKQHRPARA